MLTTRLKRLLLSGSTLHQWSAFSLKERTQIILRLFQVRISPSVLRRLYVENKVSFRCNWHCYKRAVTKKPVYDA